MTTYILKDGKPDGPLEDDIIRSHLAHGILSYDDFGWRKGMPEWEPLRHLFYKRPVTDLSAIDTRRIPRRTSVSNMPAR